jgi:hypothetical protein
LVALSVTLAACGGGGASTGKVGDTLQTYGANVTLTSVLDPAQPAPGSPSQAAYGHALVAVELTFKNPSDGSIDLSNTYKNSKLTDSKGRVRFPNPTKFSVAECQVFSKFGQLDAHQSLTGCEVFQIGAATIPTRFAIFGDPKVEWEIAVGSIQHPAALGSGFNGGTSTTLGNTGNSGTGNTGNSGTGNTGNSGTGNSGTGGVGKKGGGAGAGGTHPTAPGVSPIQVVTTSLPAASPGVPYAYQLGAIGGVAPYHWRVIDGSLPRGLRLAPRGLLAGKPKPAPAGVFIFTVRVKEAKLHHHAGYIDQPMSLALG